MSTVYTEITLKNAEDAILAKNGIIKEHEIRQMTINALVDTGAWTMVINEATRERLGLVADRTAPGILADGREEIYKLAGPLEIIWKDRSVRCDAIVVPNAAENLLGAIPLEAMDLTVNPRSEKVVGAHGDNIVHLLMCALAG